MLRATSRLRGGADVDLPGPAFIRDKRLGKLDHTQIGELLADFDLIPPDVFHSSPTQGG